MDAKKSVRQYKPASKMPARRKKKKTGWIGWFRSNIKDNVIEAEFAYGDYILSLDLSNTKEKSITKEQKDTFYKVLKSAGFTEFAE